MKFCFTMSLVLTLLTINLCRISAQTLVRLDDKAKIELTIGQLKKGIIKENIEILNEIMDTLVVLKDTVMTKTQLDSKFQRIFAIAQSRPFSSQRPAFARSTNMWDFDMVDLKMTVKEDTSIVNCELVFWAAPVDSLHWSVKQGKRLGEQMTFIKRGGSWRLLKADNLFRFLEAFGDLTIRPTD